MSVFFGTDGLRGVALSEITFDIAYKCGNSISQNLEKGSRVIIAKDTRVSGDMIVSAVSAGIMSGGVNVTNVGIVPTGALAFLTTLGFDFGIMITASHNEPEFNGIKIFNNKGEKFSDQEEEKIERGFIKNKLVKSLEVGTLTNDKKLIDEYVAFIMNTSKKLFGLRVVLDCSNGATFKIAPKIFKKLGAKIYKINCSSDGRKINQKCGSLHTQSLSKKVLKVHADIGFAFDGDGDRLIAVDENGVEIDGDKILTALATIFKAENKLLSNKVVGTSQTNMGVQKTLSERGISLERADVGDKFVLSIMKNKNLSIGGEQSGHIIIREFLQTGDGVLTAVQLANCLLKTNKTASELTKCEKFPQSNINVVVKDKIRILGSEKLADAILLVQQELAGKGRVLVRASGTEPKIRIMVESEDQCIADSLAKHLETVVKNLSIEGATCVE